MLCLRDPLRQALQEVVGDAGGLTAPMPGKIIAVHVTPGQTVRQGDTLLVMEAMKMEHAVIAPEDGVVKEIFYGVGEQVSEGVALIGLT